MEKVRVGKYRNYMSGDNLTFFEVKGFCMWPFLRDGQKILVKKTIGPDFCTGDLVLYRADGRLFCHRLLRKEKNNGNWLFYCRPDTSSGAGGDPVTENMVEGKVVGLIAGSKMVNLETPSRRLLAIAILFLLAPIVTAIGKLYMALKRVFAPALLKRGQRGSSGDRQ